MADSDPAAEHQECLDKLAALEAAIDLAEARLVILLVDNYDSFTYNLVHLLEELGAKVVVRRNDAVDADEAESLAPSHLVVSPGPGRPEQSGATLDVIRRLAPTTPTLGVCLGHQAIVEAFGGEIGPAARLLHGKTSLVHHDGEGIFAGLPQDFSAGRYHSLAAARVPECLDGLGDERRRRGDGRPPPGAAGRRRPVPPGVGAHAPGRPRPARELPGGEAMIQAGLNRVLDGHDLTPRRGAARR